MSNGDHASTIEKQSAYDPFTNRNVQSWRVRCECGWEKVVASRTIARDEHRCHKEGKPFEAPVKQQRASLTGANKKLVFEILCDRGPLRTEEVRAEFFRRGASLSEPSVRKLLHAMVVEKTVQSREMTSKRSKRVVLYFPFGTPVEVLEEKVKDFDRTPSNFSFGQVFVRSNDGRVS